MRFDCIITLLLLTVLLFLVSFNGCRAAPERTPRSLIKSDLNQMKLPSYIQDDAMEVIDAGDDSTVADEFLKQTLLGGQPGHSVDK